MFLNPEILWKNKFLKICLMHSEEDAQPKGREKGVQWKTLNAIKAEDYKIVCLSMGLDYEKLKGIYPSTSQGVVGLDTKLHEMCRSWGSKHREGTVMGYASIQNAFLVSIDKGMIAVLKANSLLIEVSMKCCCYCSNANSNN